MMEFAIVYIYRSCRKTAFVKTDVDLEALGIYYCECYIRRNKIFKFKQIIDIQYCVRIKHIEKLHSSPQKITDKLEKSKQSNNGK